jgi:uncharacterized membrane protein YgcG
MRRILLSASIGILIIALLVCVCPQAYAAETAGIYDPLDLVSNETERYVDNVNKNIFANYNIDTKLAIVLIDVFPDVIIKTEEDLDIYKCSIFEQCGLEESSYDVLIIIATQDRQYAIKTGDEIKSGTLMYDAIHVCTFDETVKALLNDKDYNAAVMEIAQHIESTMGMVESGEYDQRELIRTRNMTILKAIIIASVMALILTILIKLIIDNKNQKKSQTGKEMFCENQLQ